MFFFNMLRMFIFWQKLTKDFFQVSILSKETRPLVYIDLPSDMTYSCLFWILFYKTTKNCLILSLRRQIFGFNVLNHKELNCSSSLWLNSRYLLGVQLCYFHISRNMLRQKFDDFVQWQTRKNCGDVCLFVYLPKYVLFLTFPACF